MARQTIQNSNASLYLDGNAGYFTVPITPDPTGFSFGMWYKLNKNVANDRLIDYSDSGPSGGMNLAVVGGNRLGLGIYNGGSITSNLLANLAKGTWVHVVGTYKVNEVNLYVNGVLIGTDTSTTMSAPTQTLTFGRRSAAASNYFGGSMSNIVWHNTTTPWTAEQVLALYQSGTVPTGATAVYPLSEGAGTVAYDTSGNGNNGTITSGTWTRDTPTKTRKLVNNNLVYNGDFEIAPQVNVPTTTQFRWIDGTASGNNVPTNIFGWGIEALTGTGGAMFDNGAMKLSTTATGSRVDVTPKANSAFINTLIPVLPGTSYTATGRIKTSITSGSATVGALLRAIELAGDQSSSVINNTLATGIVATQDWTTYTLTFTTAATTRFIKMFLQFRGNDGAATLIGDAFFDDIQLYPTTPITRSANTLARQPVDELVYNGDFEYAPAFTAATTTASRWIDGTAGGTTIPSPYKWALSYTSGSGFAASFDTTEKYSGSYSMKVSTTATNSAVAAANAIATTNIPLYQLIRVSPSTSYSVTFRMKTTAISGSANGAYLRVNQYDQSGAFVSVALTTTQINTTTGWTEYTYTFTTAASGSFLNVLCAISGNTGATTLIMDAWFDNISLKLTTPTGRSAA